jgi:hypothetical protein
MNKELFEKIKEKYGNVASWAIWKAAGEKPKSNIGDMDVFDSDKNSEIFSAINPNVVMVGLNFSRSGDFENPFQNFHDKNPHVNDFKIRYAFENTTYYGAYMTDIIKNLEMASSKDVLIHLKNHPEIISQSISDFKKELELLQSKEPIILAFGNDVYDLLKENLESSFYSNLIKLTHYSHQISKENYKAEVHKQINQGTNP